MASTVNKQINRGGDCRRSAPVAASTHIYEGCLQFINSSGYATGSTASGANRFMGISVAEVDNSSGSNGDLKSETYSDGRFLLTGSGFTQADAGVPIFATDNYTITTDGTASGAVRIGTCAEYYSTTQLYVALDVDWPGHGTALTTQLTTLTHTAPGTPDYAIQNLTTTTPYGFVTADEGNSVLKVVANLQVRLAELEAVIKTHGLVA